MDLTQTELCHLCSIVNIPFFSVCRQSGEYFCTFHKPKLQVSTSFLEIGRAKLLRKEQKMTDFSKTFSCTRSSQVLLERLAVCVSQNKPVLLSGGTGTAKSLTIKFLAHKLGHKLQVISLNQQSDSTDLLGGFKPLDLKFVIGPLRDEFETLLCKIISKSKNEHFLNCLQLFFYKKRWYKLLALMEETINKVFLKLIGPVEMEHWTKVSKRIQQLKLRIKGRDNDPASYFTEGAFVKALRNGDWVVIEDFNMATARTLECLSGLLESPSGSFVLTERGDSEPLRRHPDFRLFACVDPETDNGKLPILLKKRFAEFHTKELLCTEDLSTLIRDYIPPDLSLGANQVSGIVKFYQDIKAPKNYLVDGNGHKPNYSLRSLCRALAFCARNPYRNVMRSLHEGLCLSFLTHLDEDSYKLMRSLIYTYTLATIPKSDWGPEIIIPADKEAFTLVEGYFISRGSLKPTQPQDYKITSSVQFNLRNLARIAAACSAISNNHAVLIHGETDKTRLISYLGQLTGNMCIIFNNHADTCLEPLRGSYTTERETIVFKEGVLVEALRKGSWIILEGLNLAPTYVQAVIKKLLDDQELFIPETREMIRPHKKFILFATQSPPGHHGGRKILPRALRDRLIELYFIK